MNANKANCNTPIIRMRDMKNKIGSEKSRIWKCVKMYKTITTASAMINPARLIR